MYRSAVSRLFLVLCCLVLAGCGGRELQTRVVDLGVRHLWEPDARATAQQPVALHLADESGVYLRYDVVRRQVEREWRFDATQKQDRSVKSPDAVSIAVGAATLGLTCAVDTESCFGDRGAWRDDGQIERANAQLTGKTRVGAAQAFRERLAVVVTVRGHDKQGRELGAYTHSREAVNGRLTIGVAGLAEQLPRYPERVSVSIALAPGGPEGLVLDPIPPRFYEAAAISSWQVYAPQWQSRTLQQKASINVMRTQVLAGRLDEAARTRANLVRLQWRPVPELELGYAAALAQARRGDEAREVLQALLRSADASQDTQARARQLLARL